MARDHRPRGQSSLGKGGPGKIEWPALLTTGEQVWIERLEHVSVPSPTTVYGIDSDSGERYRQVRLGLFERIGHQTDGAAS